MHRDHSSLTGERRAREISTFSPRYALYAFVPRGFHWPLSTPIGTSTLSPRLIMTCRLSSLPIQACFTSQIHPSSTPDEPGCQAVSLEREESVIRRLKLLLLLEVSRPCAPFLFPLRRSRGKGVMVVRRTRGRGGLVFRRTDPSLSLRVRRISADMRTDEWRSFFERESVGCHRHGPGWSWRCFAVPSEVGTSWLPRYLGCSCSNLSRLCDRLAVSRQCESSRYVYRRLRSGYVVGSVQHKYDIRYRIENANDRSSLCASSLFSTAPSPPRHCRRWVLLSARRFPSDNQLLSVTSFCGLVLQSSASREPSAGERNDWVRKGDFASSNFSRGLRVERFDR